MNTIFVRWIPDLDLCRIAHDLHTSQKCELIQNNGWDARDLVNWCSHINNRLIYVGRFPNWQFTAVSITLQAATSLFLSGIKNIIKDHFNH